MPLMHENVSKFMPKKTHSKQLFLDRLSIGESEMKGKPEMKIINWNISNPSILRAIEQVNWLLKKDPDIITLTETKSSKGCLYIRNRLESFGYHVLFPIPEGNEYGVLIASKQKPTPTDFSDYINYLHARVASISVRYLTKELEIIAIYVPNERSEKKKHFLHSLLNALESAPMQPYRVFCGDFNVLEPDHTPSYPKFEEWEYNFYTSLNKYQLRDAFRCLNPRVQEYSWVGKTGDGYRYDHCFVSHNLLGSINKCHYFHEVRKLKLSDHSAMYIEVTQPHKLKTINSTTD